MTRQSKIEVHTAGHRDMQDLTAAVAGAVAPASFWQPARNVARTRAGMADVRVRNIEDSFLLSSVAAGGSPGGPPAAPVHLGPPPQCLVLLQIFYTTGRYLEDEYP